MTDKIPWFTLPYAKKLCPKASSVDNLLMVLEGIPREALNTTQRLGCVLLSLCTAGKARYVINAREYELTTHDFLVLGDGQVLSDYQVSDDYQAISMLMSREMTEEIIKGMKNISRLFFISHFCPMRLEEKEVSTLFSYFRLIKQKADLRDHLFRKEIVTSLLKATLYELGNHIWKEEDVNTVCYRAERVFNNFIKLVEEHFRQERRVGWYAERLCISAKYLSETVKQVSQRTPNEWIEHYVIMEMKVQLRDTTKSVKEIAREMNFPNQSFMGKYFKQRTGLSPMHYRRG